MSNEVFPAHVAIFPDKDRTWARERGFEPYQGHIRGGEILEVVAQDIFSRGTKHLSFWALSDWNITTRPPQEIKKLYRIIAQGIYRMSYSSWVEKMKVYFRVVGWREHYGSADLEIEEEYGLIDRAVMRTKHHRGQGRVLNFFVEYSGRREEEEAKKKLAKILDKHPEVEITDRVKKAVSSLCDTPPVDLLIRTGFGKNLFNVLEEDGSSFQRPISKDFLAWYHAAGSETIHLTHRYWPDFSERDLQDALNHWLTDRLSKTLADLNSVK